MFGLTFLLLITPLLVTVAAVSQRKFWDYSIISFHINSSNENVFKPRVVLERISRGNLAISGSIEVKYDMTKDTFAELSIYRSTTGTSSTYKLLPYGVPKRAYLGILNSLYKDFLMKSLANCSNFPQFEGKLEVIEQKTYVCKLCKFSTEKFPFADAGFYKLITVISSPNASLEVIGEMLAKVELAIF